jgi:hypothetical protein
MIKTITGHAGRHCRIVEYSFKASRVGMRESITFLKEHV